MGDAEKKQFVWVSRELQDGAFAAAILGQEGLSSEQQAEERSVAAFFENPAFKRTVEFYEWGIILYLSNREKGEHFTIIAKGKLDISTGLVTSGDEKWKLLDIAPWYAELVECEQGMSKAIRITSCIGYHVHPDDAEAERRKCDGGRDPETHTVEPPCRWRERCMAFQAWAFLGGIEPAEVLEGKKPEEIVRFINRMEPRVAPQGEGLPVPLRNPFQRSEPGTVLVGDSKERLKKAETFLRMPRTAAASQISLTVKRKAPIGPAPITGDELDRRISSLTRSALSFFHSVAKDTDRRLHASRGQAKQSELFIDDHREKSGYLLLACKAPQRNVPIVRVYLKPRKMALLAQLPVDEIRPELDPVRDRMRVIRAGAYRVEVFLDSADAIPALAAVMKVLVAKKHIRLASPPVKTKIGGGLGRWADFEGSPQDEVKELPKGPPPLIPALAPKPPEQQAPETPPASVEEEGQK